MASPTVTKRIAIGVLSDALEHELLSAIEVEFDALEHPLLPTKAIVERLLLVAVEVGLRRSRTWGDVVDLTFRLDQPQQASDLEGGGG